MAKNTKKKPEFFEHVKELLTTVASLKQDVYQNSFNAFAQLKTRLEFIATDLESYMLQKDNRVVVSYTDVNRNEAWLKFGGDILIFSLHSNVFSFDDKWPIYQATYIQEDKRRAYFSVIEVFNFLSDSVKYDRMNDAGEMIARIFINVENHFFVEGLGATGTLYADLEHQIWNNETIDTCVQSFMTTSIDYDLWVPPFNDVRFIPLQNIILKNGNSPRDTSKRLGFSVANLKKQ